MYPIGLLDGYAAVNDEAGGVPYVVVRDPMTDLSTVLDRRAAGRTLTFESSGAIWRGVLVLRDRETGTYWAPATGRALSGTLAGEALAVIPVGSHDGRSLAGALPVDAVPGDRRADGGVAPPPALCVLGPGRSLRREDDGPAIRSEGDGALRRRTETTPRLQRRIRPREEEHRVHARGAPGDDRVGRGGAGCPARGAGSPRPGWRVPVVPLYWFARPRAVPGGQTLGPSTPWAVASVPDGCASGTISSSVPTENFL